MSKYVAKIPDANGYIDFNEEENGTWKLLYERQVEVIKNRACDEFIAGVKKLDMPHDRVPQCYEVSERLQHYTGWSVVPVAALIPLEEFFTLLSEKKFPAASFIRTRADLDYLQEPDIFHEFFGHCPLITQPDYADFLQWYGKTALKAKKEVRSLLGRLFWFTIEFGLINTAAGLRVFGGGILSSFEETQYALESDEPLRETFDIITTMKTDYRYDQIQKRYFIIDGMDTLEKIRSSNIVEIANQIADGGQQDDFIIC